APAVGASDDRAPARHGARRTAGPPVQPRAGRLVPTGLSGQGPLVARTRLAVPSAAADARQHRLEVLLELLLGDAGELEAGPPAVGRNVELVCPPAARKQAAPAAGQVHS